MVEKDESLSSKDDHIRRLNQELMTARSGLEESIFSANDKEMAISKLNNEVNKLKKEQRDLEE